MRKKTQRRQPKAAALPAPKRPDCDFVMERFGNLRDLDRSFDIAYWQRQADAAIYRAAWELVEFHQRDQGKDPDELRLQRTVETFQRRSSPLPRGRWVRGEELERPTPRPDTPKKEQPKSRDQNVDESEGSSEE